MTPCVADTQVQQNRGGSLQTQEHLSVQAGRQDKGDFWRLEGVTPERPSQKEAHSLLGAGYLTKHGLMLRI